MTTKCLNLGNDISNVVNIFTDTSSTMYYIINNDTTTISYGLYHNTNTYYYLTNIPENYPVAIYGMSGDIILSQQDISNIITISNDILNYYTIYVSQGADVSYANGDYFRFYDISRNLINIGNHEYAVNNTENYLSRDISSNFSFMNGVDYKFIADSCLNYNFVISKAGSDYILDVPDSSFILHIDNSSITYSISGNQYNTIQTSIQQNLTVLQDNSNNFYYYDSIKFVVKQSYNDFSYINLHVRSFANSVYGVFDKDGTHDISHEMFIYSNNCIVEHTTTRNTAISSLLDNSNIAIHFVSTVSISNNLLVFNIDNSNTSSDIEYTVYDTSYLLLNIEKNNAINLYFNDDFNNDISNQIKINSYYNDTQVVKYNNSDLLKDQYYYGIVELIVFPEFINNTTGISFNIIPDSVTGINNIVSPTIKYDSLSRIAGSSKTSDVSFSLIVKDSSQEISQYSEISLYVHKLPYKTLYVEPGFKLIDGYGNDVSFLVQSNYPTSIEDICYNEPYFYIYYRYSDFLETNSGELYRRVDIEYGANISLKLANGTIMDNSIYVNINDASADETLGLSFDIYFYDFSNIEQGVKKINLPYNLTLTGNYHDSNSTFSNPLIIPIKEPTSEDESYIEYISTYTHKEVYPKNEQSDIGDRYYLPKNIYYSEARNKLLIYNILDSDINKYHITSNLGYDYLISKNYITVFYTSVDSINYITINNNSDSNKIDSLIFTNVDEVNNIITLNQPDVSNAYLQITDNLLLYHGEASSNTIIIDLSFAFKPFTLFTVQNIFDKKTQLINLLDNKINLSAKGEYNLKIETLGLSDSNSDNLYNIYNDSHRNFLIQNNLDLTQNALKNQVLDISIIVINDRIPLISYSDRSINYNNNYNTVIFEEIANEKFTILRNTDASTFNDISNQIQQINEYRNNIDLKITSNIPIIDIFTNNIYNLDISSIDFTDSTYNDSSVNRYYIYGIDIFNTKTLTQLRLDICYNNQVPDLEFSGNAVKTIEVFNEYKDDGIIINSTFISETSQIFIETSNNIIIKDVISETYVISYSTDLCLNVVGVYELSYNVAKESSQENIIISRIINVVDTTPPSIIFLEPSYNQLLNRISQLDINVSFNELQQTDISYQDASNITINKFTSVSDISLILNYSIDLSDNYSTQQELRNNLTIDFSSLEISFNIPGTYSVIYSLIDTNGNRLSNKTRNVKISDIRQPSLIFNNRFNTSNIIFGDNNVDFSFTIASTNNQLAYQQLKEIVFDFSLIDTNIDNPRILSILYKQSATEDISYDISNATAFTTNISNIDISNETQEPVIIYTYTDNNNPKPNIGTTTRNITLFEPTKPTFTLKERLLDLEFKKTYNFLDNVDTLSHPTLVDISISNFQHRYDFSHVITDVDDIETIYTIDDISDNLDHSFNITYILVNKITGTRDAIDSGVFNIINLGPDIIIDPPVIYHEAGYYISDKSLVYGVTVVSQYNLSVDDSIKDVTVIITSIENVTTLDTFNQINPRIGEYIITFSASDINNVVNTSTRRLIVQDTQPPLIQHLGNSPIIVELNSSLIELENLLNNEIKASIIDYGDNITSTSTNNIIFFTANSNGIFTEPLTSSIKFYNISINKEISFNDIITTTETSNQYKVVYTAIDSNNNKSHLDIIINIIDTVLNPIITPTINVYNTTYNIDSIINNSTVRANFRNHSKTNQIDIVYDISNNCFKLQALDVNIFRNNIIFTGTAIDNSNNDISNNLSIYNNITSDIVTTFDNYYVIYSVFDAQNRLTTRVYEFKVFDTLSPNIKLNTSQDTILEQLISNDVCLNAIYTSTQIGREYNSPYIIGEISNNSLFDSDTRFLYKDPGVFIFDVVDKSLNYVASQDATNDNNTMYIKTPTVYPYQEISHNFYRLVHDISSVQIAILQDLSNTLHDICYNMLNIVDINSIRHTRDISYVQIYNVQDRNGNTSYISRFLKSVRLPPVIILKKTIGGYGKIYHRQYSLYRENSVAGTINYDYYDGNLGFSELSLDDNRDNRTIDDFRMYKGDYKIRYTIKNSSELTTQVKRDICVIELQPLPLTSELTIKNGELDFRNIYLDKTVYDKYGMFLTNNNSGYTITLDSNYYFEFLEEDKIGISASTNNTIVNTIGNNYYRNLIHIDIYQDFDRLSIRVRDLSLNIIDLTNQDDIILFDNFANIVEFDKINYLSTDILNNSYKKTFNVIIDNHNNSRTSHPRYKIDNKIAPVLHLPFGIYTFNQTSSSNLYNPLFFATEPSGVHISNSEWVTNFQNVNKRDYSNREIYQKNVYRSGIAGTRNGRVVIILDATTPSPIYYYNKNFSNMQGEIHISTNVMIAKDLISHEKIYNLNANVLAKGHEMSFNSVTSLDPSNTIFLKIKHTEHHVNNTNIFGLTQANLFNNVLIDKKINKIVFIKESRKRDIYRQQISKFMEIDNTYNINNKISKDYLYDTSYDVISNNREFTSNIHFKTEFVQNNETNFTYNPESGLSNFNLKFEIDMIEIYFTFINNYRTLFYKNSLDLDIFNFSIKDFNYLIKEYRSNQTFNIFNPTDRDVWLPYLNNPLLSERLIVNNIFDNFINLTLHTGIDIINYINTKLVTNSQNTKKWTNIISNFNNNFKNNTNYTVDNRYLFFTENNVSIFSTVPGETSIPVTKILNKSVSFFDSGMYLKGNIYNDISYNGYAGRDVSNTVVLSNIHDDKDYIGITQQNLFHNISHVDEKFIFHRYDSSMINNYQVTTPSLTLQETRSQEQNNNQFLLDTGALYMSMITPDKLEEYTTQDGYSNSFNINTEIDQNTGLNRDQIIGYTVNNSIDNADEIIERFSFSKQEIIIEKDNKTYTETGVFIIDLNDYFDRELYDSKIPYSNLNLEYINYSILDISYIENRLFDLYDYDAETYVIYRSKHIDALNKMRRVLVVYNFYITFVYYYFEQVFYNVSLNDISFTQIDFTTLEAITNVYNQTGNILKNYQILQNSDSINAFYIQVNYQYSIYRQLYDTMYNTFFNKFPDVYFVEEEYIDNFSIQDDKIIELSYNYYLLEKNFLNLWDGFNQLFNTEYITKNLIESENFIFDGSSNFIELREMLHDFYDHHYNLKLRKAFYKTRLELDNIIVDDTQYVYEQDIYNDTSLNRVFKTLKTNYLNLNLELNNFIMTISGGPIFPIGFHDINIHLSTNEELNTEFNTIKKIDHLYTIYYKVFSNNFNNFNKQLDSLYDQTLISNQIQRIGSYRLLGSKLLLRTFYSNSIAMKVLIEYNSYYYRNIELDRVVLDLTIPDVVAPTISFTNTHADNTEIRLFQYSETRGISYDKHFLKYINTINDIDFANNLIYSRDNSSNFPLFLNSLGTQYSLLDICYQDFITDIPINFADIIYTVRDTADNEVSITYRVNILQDNNGPVFEYKGLEVTSQTIPSLVVTQGSDIIQSVISDLNNFNITDREDDNFNPDLTSNNVKLLNTQSNTYLKIIDIITYSINTPGLFSNIILYEIQDNDGNITRLYRGIRVQELDKDEEISGIKKICCYPPARYLPIQHNHKLGSFASNSMRLAALARYYDKR